LGLELLGKTTFSRYPTFRAKLSVCTKSSWEERPMLIKLIASFAALFITVTLVTLGTSQVPNDLTAHDKKL